jgi:hypothetical protein
MAEYKEQIKLGQGKKINDTFFSSSICITDALLHAYEYNGKKYVNVNISVNANPDKYGKQVYINLNTWKPDGSKKAVNTEAVYTPTNTADKLDELNSDLPWED